MGKRFIKKLIYLILPVIIILIIDFLYIFSHYNDKATKNADCAVIFGAAVWKDDIPSHALYDRTMEAGKLYRNNLVSCIVMSGGPSTYGAHEVDVMEKILIQERIPKDALIKDLNGLNTLATLRNLDKSKSYILVSNDFHLARINILAWRIGLDEFTTHKSTYYNGRYIKESYFFSREIVGVIYYLFFMDKFHL